MIVCSFKINDVGTSETRIGSDHFIYLPPTPALTCPNSFIGDINLKKTDYGDTNLIHVEPVERRLKEA